ncbi:hypothetical protein CPB86DRAFT_455222 [Serendipita vermifera]|nr:hypothetical protein CPB86DRAFT_455222 [Serendipita vermifera]
MSVTNITSTGILSATTSMTTGDTLTTHRGPNLKYLYLLLLIPFLVALALCLSWCWFYCYQWSWRPYRVLANRQRSKEYKEEIRTRSLRYELYP